MSGKIMIQYDAVYAKTAELRNRLEAELKNMEACYRQISPTMHNMDSKTNAVFVETMLENRRKAEITSETLHRLLTFIELSARQVERDEILLKGKFSIGSGATGDFNRGAGLTASETPEKVAESEGEHNA